MLSPAFCQRPVRQRPVRHCKGLRQTARLRRTARLRDPHRRHRILTAGAIALLLLVAVPACSGSGGDPASPASFPVAAAVESVSFSLMNQARADAGRDRLMLDAALSQIARDHSEAMRDEGFFAHVDPDGNGPSARVRAVGVTFRSLAENLANVSGDQDPATRAHRALLDNADHRRNMLDARWEIAGVGVAKRGGEFWITHLYLLP